MNSIGLEEHKTGFECDLSQAIALTSQTVEKAQNTLDMLAPCFWPRLVLAQAEIEALRLELRAARDGEERAYEALKRLRTRSRTQTRPSSRARNAIVTEELTLVPSVNQHRSTDESTMITPANQHTHLAMSSVARASDDMLAPNREIATVQRFNEESNPPGQGLKKEELVFSGSGSPDTIRSVLIRELQGTQDRLAAAALREEALRKDLENARRLMEALEGENSRLSGGDDSFCLRLAERDGLRREIARRDGIIAELLAQLQEEQLKCARNRDVAATVRLPLQPNRSLNTFIRFDCCIL